MDSRDILKAESIGFIGQLDLYSRQGSIHVSAIPDQLAWHGLWNVHFDKQSNPGDFVEDGSPAIFFKMLGRQR